MNDYMEFTIIYDGYDIINEEDFFDNDEQFYEEEVLKKG